MWFDPSTPTLEIFNYYKRNLRRFTKLLVRGDLDKLFRPGKFATEPPNNLELILRYKDVHFEGMINSTKNKYEQFDIQSFDIFYISQYAFE